MHFSIGCIEGPLFGDARDKIDGETRHCVFLRGGEVYRAGQRISHEIGFKMTKTQVAIQDFLMKEAEVSKKR
jgi:hypothetical protein